MCVGTHVYMSCMYLDHYDEVERDKSYTKIDVSIFHIVVGTVVFMSNGIYT
jgi:hypothetical protein